MSTPSDQRPLYDASALKRLILPLTVGVTAARHIAWYVTYQVTGEGR
jgi:hypothetical protein